MASSSGGPPLDPQPWTIKSGRPRSVPTCQNTESKPHLSEQSSKCEPNEQCFYYRCQNCLPELVLGDLLGANYEEELVHIPPIESVKPRKKMFEYDHGYHGEIAEFFGNYLNRMTGVKGLAINGWANTDAQKIFNNVETTFR